eukprot:gene2691-2941_t
MDFIDSINKNPLLAGILPSDNLKDTNSPNDENQSVSAKAESKSKSLALAVNASWAVNWLLLVGKAVVVGMSHSKAMTAALVDSAVDLLSQFVLSLADRYMSKHSHLYPVGRSRLEALSVIACAFIMSMASVEVIQYSAEDIADGLEGKKSELEVGIVLFLITGIGIFLKFVLWIYCTALNKVAQSDMLVALAEDHFNDVISNIAAIVAVVVAYYTTAWWVDPAGAIIISLVIIYRWVFIIHEQVKKIVGHTAPPEFIHEVEKIALAHDDRIIVDCTRVYYFGARYNVEMEIVLPGSMTVRESHDIALAVQHKIEELEDVERAFVHVDHERRDGLEHKIERELVLKSLNNTNPSASDRSPSPSGGSSPVSPVLQHLSIETATNA